MSKLPNGWASATLGVVASFEMGQAPPGAASNFDGIGTPFVKAGEFGELRPIIREWTTAPLKFGRARDVFICVVGATAGKLNLGVDCAIGRSVAAIKPETLELQKFLYYQLLPRVLEMRSASSGSAQGVISQKDLSSLDIVIAPVAEQTRIVEKLEELLSDLDAGVAELKSAQKKLGQYRQSLLKAAVEGALTAEWRAARKVGAGDPAPETGAQLLQRILTERRARWEAKQLTKFAEQGKPPPKDWQKKYPEPVQPDTSDLPELPVGWVWASLGELLEGLTSGSRDWAPYYGRGSCVFVMAQNVRSWRPNFSFRQYVDPPVGNRDRARSEIRKDDLLVTIVGVNTGDACRVNEAVESHFVCQSVALLRLVETGLSEYVNAVLNSEGHGQRQFREMNYGAGRPHLSFDQIESVCVPLPPSDEQAEIINQVELALGATNEVEAQFVYLHKQSAAQRKNILKAAFSGQLVPQDSNDEPASVLLDRIRAERAARDALKKPHRRKARELA